MNTAIVDKIARTVLYEGYLLYPYRESALKNQQRWNFGVLFPPAWAVGQSGSDRSYFQMECLAETTETATLSILVRFLQVEPQGEAVEREVALDRLPLTDHKSTFSFEPLEGEIELAAASVDAGLYRLSLRVRNTNPVRCTTRNDALLFSLASAHAVVAIENGAFISQTDPGPAFESDAAQCQNAGVWPILVGDKGTRDTVLASPIILYDYPQIAAESGGDLFDSTEIDEILSLRILTLTDAEKDELRRSDQRARELLERLENSPADHLMQLHGRIRELRPEWKRGDRVRLRPCKRADIFDTLLDGKIAIIEAVEQDFEGNVHFAVVLEDDPGRDLGELRQIGHRFFFSPAEIEPCFPPS